MAYRFPQNVTGTPVTRHHLPPVVPWYTMGLYPYGPFRGAFTHRNHGMGSPVVLVLNAPPAPILPAQSLNTEHPPTIVNNYHNCTIYSGEGGNIVATNRHHAGSISNIHTGPTGNGSSPTPGPTGNGNSTPPAGINIVNIEANAVSTNMTTFSGDSSSCSSNDSSFSLEITSKPKCKKLRAPKTILKKAIVTKRVANNKKYTLPYKNNGLTSSLSMVPESKIPGKDRIVARSRQWSTATTSYGNWRLYVADPNRTQPIVFRLNRGGAIKFFPSICSVQKIKNIKKEMTNVSLFKQYKVRPCGKEPRVHALFSTDGKGGFQYGRVKMGSGSLESLPHISKAAKSFARKFNLPGDKWNIGCHLVMYRNGRDSINWHAVDTQGEDCVLSLTVDAPEDPRTICFQPANTIELKNGDEQIELYPGPGDAYSMDEAVQSGYVHAMLKTKESKILDGKRMAIIFRNGIFQPKLQQQDNGIPINSLDGTLGVEYIFGKISNLNEGCVYSRDDLMDMKAHQNVGGAIDGNGLMGCPSLDVCYLTRKNDMDGFQFLTYQVGDHSRHQGMVTSFFEKKPIRVFRSSKGNKDKGKYFPVTPKKGTVVYRYDGLYYIIGARSADGDIVDSGQISTGVTARVFFLVRAEPSAIMNTLWRKHPKSKLSFLVCVYVFLLGLRSRFWDQGAGFWDRGVIYT
jgi:hypothetical protein